MAGGKGDEPPREAGYPDKKRRMPTIGAGETRACYKHTCRIQKCLSETNYDNAACSWAIDALKACCEKYGKDSIHCAFPKDA